MPGMSGEDTLPELRKIRSEVKIFVSSGYSDAEAATMFRSQRVSGFVQKPYTFAVLRLEEPAVAPFLGCREGEMR